MPQAPSRRSRIARRSRLIRSLLVLAALVALGGGYTVVLGALGVPVGPRAAAVDAPADLIAEGRALYLTSCSSCHGLNAAGTSDGPSLIGAGAAAVHFQVSTGRMPAATTEKQQIADKPRVFSAAEVAALAAYVATLGPGPPIPTDGQLDLAGTNPARGGVVFRTNCASCHNFTGRGGALSQGKYAPEINASTRQIYEAMLTGPQSMPVYGNGTIDPDTKRDIIAYLATVGAVGGIDDPNPGGYGLGRIGPVAEGLLAWTVVLGVLIAFAVWLGAKAR